MRRNRDYSYKRAFEANLKNLSQKRISVYFLKSEIMKEAMEERQNEIEQKKKKQKKRYEKKVLKEKEEKEERKRKEEEDARRQEQRVKDRSPARGSIRPDKGRADERLRERLENEKKKAEFEKKLIEMKAKQERERMQKKLDQLKKELQTEKEQRRKEQGQRKQQEQEHKKALQSAAANQPKGNSTPVGGGVSSSSLQIQTRPQSGLGNGQNPVPVTPSQTVPNAPPSQPQAMPTPSADPSQASLQAGAPQSPVQAPASPVTPSSVQTPQAVALPTPVQNPINGANSGNDTQVSDPNSGNNLILSNLFLRESFLIKEPIKRTAQSADETAINGIEQKEKFLSENLKDYFPESDILEFANKFENFTLDSNDLSKTPISLRA